MPYDHKKSNRTLTDEQFSDGTTVDGTRIDQALQDSVEHFNEVPVGDSSTRMTQQQFVFGYQPAMYTSMPDTKAASTVGMAIDRLPAKYRTAKGTTAGTTLPWVPLKNNEYTTVTTNSSTDWATVTSLALQSSTPSGGFQNKWRYKGTKIREWDDAITGEISNEGPLEGVNWADFWLRGENTAGDRRKLENGYQYAWSHSWNFADPCILHDLMLYLRTDRRGVLNFGYYSKPLAYLAQKAAGYATNAAWSCKQLYVSICVDNPFAQEDRSMNDNEVIIWNRRIDAASTHSPGRYSMLPSPTEAYSDMSPPVEFDTGVTTGGDGLYGFAYRLSDMNIPIHRNARVRMAIAIPWYSSITSTPSMTSVTGEGNIRKGWADPHMNSPGTETTMFKKAFWQGAVSDPPVATDITDCPLGAEPMGGMSISGCLTILEEGSK